MAEHHQTLTIQQAIDLAVQHHTAGRLSQAETIYNQILQSDPNQPVALHLLGVVAHQTGMNDKAADLITKALKLKPDLAEAHNNLGNALRDLGKLEEAVASYHKALGIKPDYAEAHNNLGNALRDLGKLEEAVARYHKALGIKPDYAEAHNNLGAALKDLGKLEEAIASYHKALGIKPDYAEAHNNLGNALQELGKPEETVASYQKALALKPDYAIAHYNLGNALRNFGNLEEAVSSYHKAIALRCDYVNAQNNLGVALLELGKDEEAAATLVNAATIVLEQNLEENFLENCNDPIHLINTAYLNNTSMRVSSFIKAFIDICCTAIARILDRQEFDVAGEKIRWLYMLVAHDETFNALIQRYFDSVDAEEVFDALGVHARATHLSMRSQYFYQNGQYGEAEGCARRCVNQTKVLLEDETHCNDGWLLVKKSLKKIKNSAKARILLEQLLLTVVK